jgi:hypothetical protein
MLWLCCTPREAQHQGTGMLDTHWGHHQLLCRLFEVCQATCLPCRIACCLQGYGCTAWRSRQQDKQEGGPNQATLGILQAFQEEPGPHVGFCWWIKQLRKLSWQLTEGKSSISCRLAVAGSDTSVALPIQDHCEICPFWGGHIILVMTIKGGWVPDKQTISAFWLPSGMALPCLNSPVTKYTTGSYIPG